MKNPKQKKYTPLLAALATLIVLLAAVVLLWLAEVRPQVTKGRSEIITDFLRAELIHDGEPAGSADDRAVVLPARGAAQRCAGGGAL